MSLRSERLGGDQNSPWTSLSNLVGAQPWRRGAMNGYSVCLRDVPNIAHAKSPKESCAGFALERSSEPRAKNVWASTGTEKTIKKGGHISERAQQTPGSARAVNDHEQRPAPPCAQDLPVRPPDGSTGDGRKTAAGAAHSGHVLASTPRPASARRPCALAAARRPGHHLWTGRWWSLLGGQLGLQLRALEHRAHVDAQQGGDNLAARPQHTRGYWTALRGENEVTEGEGEE